MLFAIRTQKGRCKRMMQFKVQKLFGRFNYDLQLNKEGLTILTGPNGFGKSTILKCIEALNKGVLGVSYYFTLDFEKIEVILENYKITIQKKKDNIFINEIKFSKKQFENMVTHLDRRPYMRRVDKDTWIDIRNGNYITTNDYFKEIYSDDEESLYVLNENGFSGLVEEMKKISMYIGTIYFIREQRLIAEKHNHRTEKKMVNVINQLPDKFRELVLKLSNDYSIVANKLDSTYTNRLFSNEEKINEEEYRKKMFIMDEKFEKLNKYDLSNTQKSEGVVFKEEHAKALKIYFDDFDEKYKVYEDLINKLDMYTEIINSRLKFKNIKISRNDGITIVDSENEEKTIPLNKLSSGEKQEIVLFYELIFESGDNGLLLIDEPEISLHIAWQKMFMDDLLRIVKYKGINVIVATHSPQIINNHWERQIDLGEIYGGEIHGEQFDKK